MIIEVSPLTFAATIGIALLGPALTVLFDSWWGGARATRSTIGISAVGWLTWLASVAVWRPELDPVLVLPIAALGGLAAILAVTPMRMLGHGAPTAVAFAALWSFAVYAPIAIALFSTTDGVLGAGLATLDLAGALPVLVAAGSTGAVILLVDRRRPARRPNVPVRRWLLPVVFAVIWLLWILWLVGLELAIDEVTGRIIVNAVVAPIVSAVAWLVVQRARHAKTTMVAALSGLLCGLVAITAGSGFIDPIGAGLTGLVAGALCSLIGYGLLRRTGQPAWLLVAILVVAASIGVGLVGVFATRAGLMFTGQPELLFAQVASAALVIGYAVFASTVIWLPVRAILTRRARASVDVTA